MNRREYDGANTETEQVLPYGTNDLSPEELSEVLSELCLLLRLRVVRTNATRHGGVELRIEEVGA